MTVYIAEDLPDETDVPLYIREPSPPLQPGGDLLARSLQQLQDGLDSGTVMTQFEVRWRHSTLSLTCARSVVDRQLQVSQLGELSLPSFSGR